MPEIFGEINEPAKARLRRPASQLVIVWFKAFKQSAGTVVPVPNPFRGMKNGRGMISAFDGAKRAKDRRRERKAMLKTYKDVKLGGRRSRAES